MSRILLVDDDRSLRGVLAFALREEGYEVDEGADGEEGLALFRERPPDLMITDLKMPRMDGMALLAAVRSEAPEIPVLVLTAYGTIEQAVEAMRLGAFHYLTKPYSRDELRIVVANALEGARLRAENRDLRTRLRQRRGKIPLVYASSAMEVVVDVVRRVAPTDATVLVTGESGTGKELIARALHDLSDRWENRFVAINCGALPKDLVESELFGHTKGAFTGATRDKPGKFQLASGGTLFLDEIGDLAPELQAKLLRVLETGEVDVVGGREAVPVDVRLLAATNSDLGAAAAAGRFREDLYYRLHVVPIRVPPLRERPEDIPALWEHFVALHGKGEAIRTDPDLMNRLVRMPWKGNVRELANLCQRMVLLRRGDTLRLEDAPAEPGPSHPSESPGPLVGSLPDGSLSLAKVEEEIIRKALFKFEGNKSRAARYLGIPRHVLLYRLKKYGI